MKRALSAWLAACLLLTMPAGLSEAAPEEVAAPPVEAAAVEEDAMLELPASEAVEQEAREEAFALGDEVPEANGTAGCAIDDWNFPDDKFRAIVQQQFDADGDGMLSPEEIEAATALDCGGKGIASLKGVERLTALTVLRCAGNKLTALDVSRNAALQELYCGDNLLTALSVGRNPALTKLHCAGNQLVALDVGHASALRELDCKNNLLTELDVSYNASLTGLNCSANLLMELDVSYNAALRWLYCAYNALLALDVSGCPALNDLRCAGNLIPALDVSHNPALGYLYCSDNLLEKLDIRECPALVQCYQEGAHSEIGKGISRYYISASQALYVDSAAVVVDTDEALERIPRIELQCPVADYIGIKQKAQLTAVAHGPKVSVKKLRWSSSDTSVATVNSRGVVTGRGVGRAVITAATPDGLSDAVEIIVRDTHAPTGVTLTAPGGAVVEVKQTLQLRAEMTALEKPVSKLTWKSSAPAVAKVTSSGRVTGKKAGTAVITVTTANGHSDSIEITVHDPHAPISVAIEADGDTAIAPKAKLRLRAVMTAEAEPVSKLKWTTSNKRVATVSSKGVVTGKKAGRAMITVSTANGLKADIEIVVG